MIAGLIVSPAYFMYITSLCKTITPGESVRNKAGRSTFKGYFTYKCSQVTI